MEPSDNTGDKVTPTSSFFNGATILALLIIVVQVLVSAGTYPFLPPMVPSRFDLSGQVYGYMPKLVYAILLPGISIVLFLILRFITQIGPNLGYRNQSRANTQIVNLILVGVLLFNLVIQLLITSYALGAHVDVSLVVCLAVSVLILFLGNYLGKLRRNFWAGIRTPWTLASDIAPQNLLYRHRPERDFYQSGAPGLCSLDLFLLRSLYSIERTRRCYERF
jgi:uncharacterized membrane protein